MAKESMAKEEEEPDRLSRRERQIMDIIHKVGRAGAGQVLQQMPDPPSYSAVRAMLRVLEAKGHLCHEREGLAYVYLATVPPSVSRRSATSHLLRTFFNGSAERAVATVLEVSQGKLSHAELDRIAALVEAARKEDR
jgi:BlaI family transcriptional regulator, penicillinase repressor